MSGPTASGPETRWPPHESMASRQPRLMAVAVLVSLAVTAPSQSRAEPGHDACPFAGSLPLLPADLEDRIASLPGLGCVAGLQLAGYLPVSDHPAYPGKVFFWFVGSEDAADRAPIVFWLNGGPGSSSLFGFFAENGPYEITPDGRLAARRYSWTERTSYLVIEQTTSVGLSVASPAPLRDEAQAMDQLWYALHAFFQRYPELRTCPLYLAGQSYAGKYLPQLAVRILRDRQGAGGQQTGLNLRGLLVGDGWVDPLVQQSADADFAYAHGLIDTATRAEVERLYAECVRAIGRQVPSSREANQLCGKMQDLIKASSGLARTTFLRVPDDAAPTPPADDLLARYLDSPAVRSALRVDPRAPRFEVFSQRTEQELEVGEQDSAAHLYPLILAAGVPVLVYNGLEDGTDSNFMGTDRWLARLDWPGRDAFAAARTCVWRGPSGVAAGYVRSARGLTQVKVRGAGHLAPADQPRNVQDMLHRFVFGRDFCQ